MSLLNKNTDYAVRALLVVASSDKEWVSSREISEVQGIPLQFVRRVLQELVAGSLLISKEGAYGGVKLNKSAEEISLAEIAQLCQGKIQISACLFRKKICPNKSTCALCARLTTIEQMVLNQFGDITLKTLIEDTK